MSIVNFFREDFNEVLGIYCDEEKIFLARLTDKIETAEINFEVDLNDTTPLIYQLATTIKNFCNTHGWKTSKVGVVLREGSAATFQTEFKNVPADEIENAVKIWAMAHVGKNPRYTSIKFDNEIWMAALPAAIVDEYISAFEKNSMILCALTEFPTIDSQRSPTPFNRAIFAADIVRNKKSPNILAKKISTWNVTKISLTAAAVFFILLAGYSMFLAQIYYSAATRAQTAQERLNALDDTFILKNTLDATTANLAQFNAQIATQNIFPQNFNALVKIANIPDNKIILNKIKASNQNLELEGAAESSDAIKYYLSRLKNSIQRKINLQNSNELDGQNFFSISLLFD